MAAGNVELKASRREVGAMVSVVVWENGLEPSMMSLNVGYRTSLWALIA